jgi:hypothetical protein
LFLKTYVFRDEQHYWASWANQFGFRRFFFPSLTQEGEFEGADLSIHKISAMRDRAVNG